MPDTVLISVMTTEMILQEDLITFSYCGQVLSLFERSSIFLFNYLKQDYRIVFIYGQRF